MGRLEIFVLGMRVGVGFLQRWLHKWDKPSACSAPAPAIPLEPCFSNGLCSVSWLCDNSLQRATLFISWSIYFAQRLVSWGKETSYNWKILENIFTLFKKTHACVMEWKLMCFKAEDFNSICKFLWSSFARLRPASIGFPLFGKYRVPSL